jgi:hypothetical protein
VKQARTSNERDTQTRLKEIGGGWNLLNFRQIDEREPRGSNRSNERGVEDFVERLLHHFIISHLKPDAEASGDLFAQLDTAPPCLKKSD